MAVHNGERYVRETINSILNQTYKDFEFLIIDDGSTDNTSHIISSYDDNRIKLTKNPLTLGLTKSLNIGMEQSVGEYIARIDADDIAIENRLEIQLEYLEKNKDITCVGGSSEIIDVDGKIVGIKKSITDGELLKFHMMIKNQISHPTTMFRKSEIVQIGGYNENFVYAQDYELWCRLLERGFNISSIDNILIKYRNYNASITQGKETKDTAYSFALKTIFRNISRYTEITKTDFITFTDSLHKHKIRGLKQLITTNRVLIKFVKKYTKKEKTPPKTLVMIQKFARKEVLNSVKWYLKYLLKR